MAFNWSQYAVGGALRPDSFSGMQPAFQAALQNLFLGAPEEIRNSLRVGSGFRSPERQEQLWQQALKKYGSPEAARKWVAPPGRSQHNHGHAADLKYLSDDARKWVHENASRFGLAFPLSNENWHIELANARGGKPSAIPLPSASPHGPQIANDAPHAASTSVFGGMSPTATPAAASQPSAPVPEAVRQTANPSPTGNPASDIFGMLAMAQPQGPQFSPVQIMGPTPEQASGLSQLVQALRSRII